MRRPILRFRSTLFENIIIQFLDYFKLLEQSENKIGKGNLDFNTYVHEHHSSIRQLGLSMGLSDYQIFILNKNELNIFCYN